jgi:hypothetical protein
MGKRGTILAVTALAVLLAGIALAVIRLYRSASGTDTDHAAPAGWSVLKAVPSDAAAVLVLDGTSKAARVAADSTGLLQGLVAPGNAPFMAFLSAAAARYPVAVSLHNSGSLVPLVAIQAAAPDSTLLDLAPAAGLKTQVKDGFLLASRSETFLGASVRHLQEGISVLGTRHLQELLRGVSGHVVLEQTRNSVVNIEPGYEAIVQGLDHCLVALRDHSLLVCRLDDEQQIKHWVEKL